MSELKKCICIKSLKTPFGSFKKDVEYSCRIECNVIGYRQESVYVYFLKRERPSSFEGVRFSLDKDSPNWINTGITNNDFAYFYEYFANSRLAKLKKIQSIYG